MQKEQQKIKKAGKCRQHASSAASCSEKLTVTSISIIIIINFVCTIYTFNAWAAAYGREFGKRAQKNKCVASSEEENYEFFATNWHTTFPNFEQLNLLQFCLLYFIYNWCLDFFSCFVYRIDMLALQLKLKSCFDFFRV